LSLNTKAILQGFGYEEIKNIDDIKPKIEDMSSDQLINYLVRDIGKANPQKQ
jgi:hypothetical protein